MRRWFIALASILIALALLFGVGFDRLVDKLLRPWVAARAAMALGGEVGIDHLELGWNRLELSGVQAERSGLFRLKVAQVGVRFTFAGLWQRQLESVVIRQPDVEVTKPGTEPGTGSIGGKPAPWPRQPPLQVENWTVEQGRLLLPLGQDNVLLQDLEAAGRLASRFTVKTSARLGAEPGEVLALSGHGTWEGPPELTVTDLLWSGRSLLQAPVTVTPGSKSLEVDLALAQLDDTEATRLLAAIDRKPPWPPELAWRVTAPRLTVGIDGERLSLRLETGEGEVRRPNVRMPWESLLLQLSSTAGGWEIGGKTILPAQTRVQLNGHWTESRFAGNWQLAAPFPAKLGAAFGFKLPPPAEKVRELTLAGDLQAAAGTVTLARIRLSARIQDGGRLSSTFSGRWQEGAAVVEATDLAVWQETDRLAAASFKLAGNPAEKDWRGSWRLQVPDAHRLSRALAVAMPAKLPNLRELELWGDLASADGRLLLPKAGMSGQLAGTGLSGRLSGQMTVRQLAAGWHLELAQLAATELEYLAEDGLAGLSGGALRLAGTLDWQERLTYALHGQAAVGDALVGSWYADLRGLPLELALAGGWAPASGRLRLDSGRLDLAGLATARLQGALAGEQLELQGEIAVPRLDGAFQTRLRQLAGGTLPGLDRLELAGSLTASGSGRWQPKGWELAATVRPADMTLARGETLRLAGLTGELPLLLRRGPAAPAVERSTTLHWDGLRAGPLSSAGGQLRLTVGPNRWQLADPLRLAVGGGWLDLAKFTLEYSDTGPEMHAALKATAVDMAELSRALGWAELGGRLEAEFPDISVTGEEISIGGEALLQLFDGTVQVRNLRMGKPFSRYPTYHADIDFSGINLQLLTRAFAFGEMNGVADGFVHDLRLFGPVPSAFRARFETRPQGTRNISVKALRNLNTLSQGGISAALSQGIYRFFDFYHYRKIGIRCGLRNDIFYLEGTARPGTTTHLIDGGLLPPRIEVIVTTPTVSFQEMVKRLKRIDRKGD